jgi:hypothetical protein
MKIDFPIRLLRVIADLPLLDDPASTSTGQPDLPARNMPAGILFGDRLRAHSVSVQHVEGDRIGTFAYVVFGLGRS